MPNVSQNMPIYNQSMKKQQGFSLIEALVAFLIISVGMLGIASLQVVALRAGYTATLRTAAVIKSEEILERMRANESALAAYNVATGGGTGAPGKLCSDGTGTVVSCTPAEMAPFDIYKWKQDLLSVFPANTTASIVVAAPVATLQPLSIVTVTINWKDRNPDASTLIDMSYTTEQQMCGAVAC